MENKVDKINILLVDDRPENLLALEAIIEKEEYNLVKASSGEEALKYLLKFDFAAILLDVQMPGMDGFGTAKIIKAREKTKNIPILFITANNMESSHIFTGYSIGAIDYIIKPFDPFILKAKVEGFVELYKMKQQLILQAELLTEKNREIEHLAYHDQLTNLPNRRLFNDQLIEQLHRSKKLNQPLAILYLDIDRFKYVNDSLGHVIGDKLLEKIAKRLTDIIREGDVVARVGGDEFTIMLPATDRENALEIAEQIIDSFKEPFLIDKYELYITTSIGLSIFPYDGEDTITLNKNADAALYRAKEQGKNKYKVFHSGMNIYSYRTFLMQNDLRKAIERNELFIVYQPRVDISTNKISSAEALLRWNHSTWGTISPTEFIPIAEETGQIVEIGEWVLKSVCEQLVKWKENGLSDIRIAINFSPKQFLQKNLVEIIKQTLEDSGIHPTQIEIEITEAVLLNNEEIISHVIQQLRMMGIRISIDDFGTEYSSFNYLRRFPVDTIKIDKSFVQDISKNRSDSRAFIQAMTTIAHALDMSVIAEGVETEQQLNMVREEQCNEFQGFLFSRPISPEKFEKFITLENQNDILLKTENSIIQNRKQQEEIHRLPVVPEKVLKQDILEAAINRTKEIHSISIRELDVFKLIINGLSNREISEQLYISEHTVKNHITRIFQKLNVTDRVQAMALVYETIINEGENLSVQ